MPPTSSSSSVRRRKIRRTFRRRRWLTPKLRGAITLSSGLRLTRFLRRWNRLDEIYTFMPMGIRKLRTQIREKTCTAGEKKNVLLTSSRMFWTLHISKFIIITQNKYKPKKKKLLNSWIQFFFFWPVQESNNTFTLHAKKKNPDDTRTRSCSNPVGKHSRTKKTVNILVVHALSDLEKHRHFHAVQIKRISMFTQTYTYTCI